MFVVGVGLETKELLGEKKTGKTEEGDRKTVVMWIAKCTFKGNSPP